MSVKGIVEEQYPSWDTAGRPNVPVMGQSGWNYELQQFEVWDDNDNDWIAESNSQTASHSFLEFTYGRIAAPEISSLVVNASTGSDALAFNEYPGAKFATLSKALEYVNYSTSTKFLISLETDCAISSTTIVNNKTVRIVGSFNVTVGSNVTFESCNVYWTGVSKSINSARSIRYINCNVEMLNGVLTYAASTSRLYVNGIVNFTFGDGTCSTVNANNSYIFTTDNQESVLYLRFTSASIVNFNTTEQNAFLFHTKIKHATIFKSSDTVDISFLTSYTLSAGNLIVYDSNKYVYDNNALAHADGAWVGTVYYTSNGERRQVILGLANDEKSWTSAGRPGTPYLGMDGFNTTDSVREYWDGTNWIQY